MLKKLVRFLMIDLKQKSTSLHKTDEFQIEKIIDMWAEVFSLFTQSQDQHCHVFIELDSYFMIDLVFILFIKFLDLFSCTKKKHQHIVSNLKNVSEISSVTYEIYHLWLCIMNQWNHFLEFIQSFIVVDCNSQNSQVLLDRSALKDFKINICNSIDSWEFEWKSHMTEISAHHFVKKLISTAHVFEVWTAYRLCLDSNDETDFWKNNCNSSDNLINVFKRLCVKYCDFFNT